MTHTDHEKALAIHRVVECDFGINRGLQGSSSASANGIWYQGEDMLAAISAAFKSWAQAWRVQQEMNPSPIPSMGPTDVQTTPPQKFYKVPERLVTLYAGIYDTFATTGGSYVDGELWHSGECYVALASEGKLGTTLVGQVEALRLRLAGISAEGN